MKGAPPAPGPGIALFLDIDGTLLEHQPHPDGVFVDDALRNLLIIAWLHFVQPLARARGRLRGVMSPP